MLLTLDSLLLTLVSSLLTLVSLLLTLVSSLLTLVVSRPLPLTQGVGSTRPPCSHVPLPPHQGGEGGSSVDPSGRSEFAANPRHRISPSFGCESGPAGQVDTTVLPANPSLAPRGSAPHPLGEGSEPACRLGPDQQLCVSFPRFRIPPDSGPARPLGLTWSETVLAWTHRHQLRQQLRIFWPCIIAVSRMV
jgi:hypothetical protein